MNGEENISLKELAMIGIDGGGTKTEFVLFTSVGTVLKRIISEGTNINSVGIDKATHILKKGIDALLSSKENVVGIYAGVAGCGGKENKDAVISFLESEYPNLLIGCSSDIQNIISCANTNHCIAVICGTGSCVFALDEYGLHQTGGWGYMLGDEGSGFFIGRDVLRTTLAYNDGFGEHSLLVKLAEEKLNGSVNEKIPHIYSKGRDFVASFAPLCFEAQKKNDKLATEIIERNADSLAKQIKFAYEKYGEPDCVVLSGGVITANPDYLDFIKKKSGLDAEFTLITTPQVYGACLSCVKLCGIALKETFLVEFEKTYAEKRSF